MLSGWEVGGAGKILFGWSGSPGGQEIPVVLPVGTGLRVSSDCSTPLVLSLPWRWSWGWRELSPGRREGAARMGGGHGEAEREGKGLRTEGAGE